MERSARATEAGPRATEAGPRAMEASPRAAESDPGSAGSGPRAAGTGPRRVLYRCRVPTDFLCPCGATARALKRAGLEHRTERVPLRRGERPEIVELTGQRRVPVLVDGDEVIWDSRRIREYVGWRYIIDSDG